MHQQPREMAQVVGKSEEHAGEGKRPKKNLSHTVTIGFCYTVFACDEFSHKYTTLGSL